MNIQTSKTTTKKPFIIILTAAILLGLGFLYAYYATDIFSDQSPSEATNRSTGVNLDPPTEQEVNDSQNAKERLLEDGKTNTKQETEDPKQSKKEAATVGISYAGVLDGKLEIRAFTPTVIEGTGTCTASVSKSGASTITKSTAAFVDASSTICEPIYIPRSSLSPGTWSIDVAFSSPTHEGSSGPTKVEVR